MYVQACPAFFRRARTSPVLSRTGRQRRRPSRHLSRPRRAAPPTKPPSTLRAAALPLVLSQSSQVNVRRSRSTSSRESTRQSSTRASREISQASVSRAQIASGRQRSMGSSTARARASRTGAPQDASSALPSLMRRDAPASPLLHRRRAEPDTQERDD